MNDEYEVRILVGRAGFPAGAWTRVCYRAMANDIAKRLADEGVLAVTLFVRWEARS